jgi:hypothetical protein
MTTIDSSLSSIIALKLARRASKRRDAAMTRVSTVAMLSLVRLVLHVAGFSSLTYAAFTWDKIAGFIVAGICCFVFSTLFTARQPEPDNRR